MTFFLLIDFSKIRGANEYVDKVSRHGIARMLMFEDLLCFETSSYCMCFVINEDLVGGGATPMKPQRFVEYLLLFGYFNNLHIQIHTFPYIAVGVVGSNSRQNKLNLALVFSRSPDVNWRS